MAEPPFKKKTDTENVSKVKILAQRTRFFRAKQKEVTMKIKKEYFILTGVMAALILYLVLHRSDRTHYKLPDIT
ncbi:MAG: hypothetical protein DRH24_14785, partial [Deltaproteobacteria bacterium]